MINIQGKIPQKVTVACSGGVDSMAVLDFLRCGRHDVTALYVNHRTPYADSAEALVGKYCEVHSIPFRAFPISDASIPNGMSKEDYWRQERYEIFHNNASGLVITAHTLDDCVETWVWSSLHGEGKIIPSRRGPVIRPFRLTYKEDLRKWAINKNVPWIEDPSNEDLTFMRNFIRHKLLDDCKVVNPGLEKVIRKKILKDSPSENWI